MQFWSFLRSEKHNSKSADTLAQMPPPPQPPKLVWTLQSQAHHKVKITYASTLTVHQEQSENCRTGAYMGPPALACLLPFPSEAAENLSGSMTCQCLTEPVNGRRRAGVPKLTSGLFQKNNSVIWSLVSFVELGKQFLITHSFPLQTAAPRRK